MTQPDPRQPGDFAAVPMHTAAAGPIEFGEWLNGDGFGPYQHALMYIGDGLVIEAEPDGARIRERGVEAGDLWSTGAPGLALTIAQQKMVRAAARRYEGVGYSYLDYVAIAAHRLRIPAPHLRRFVADTGHMICSQLVDQIRVEVGSHLFRDRRWPGYVTPLALAGVIRTALAARLYSL